VSLSDALVATKLLAKDETVAHGFRRCAALWVIAVDAARR
jgi:hypothetical protein